MPGARPPATRPTRGAAGGDRGRAHAASSARRSVANSARLQAARTRFDSAWAKHASITSGRAAPVSLAQVEKVLRKPCTVVRSRQPRRSSTRRIASPERGRLSRSTAAGDAIPALHCVRGPGHHLVGLIPRTFRTLRGGAGRNLPRLAPPIGPTTRTLQCRDRPRCRGTWALNHRSAPITFCRSAPGREPIGRHAGSCPSAWCQPRSGSYPVAGSHGDGVGGPMTGAIRSLT